MIVGEAGTVCQKEGEFFKFFMIIFYDSIKANGGRRTSVNGKPKFVTSNG